MTNIVVTIVSMAAGIIIARSLGPELRGYYGLVIYAVNFLFLGNLGLGAAITYYTGKRPEERGKILGFVITSSFTLGCLFAVAFYFAYPHIADIWTDIPRPIMVIGLAAVPFFFFINYFNQFQMGMLRVLQSNIINLVRIVSYLACIVVLILFMNGKVLETTIGFSVSLIVTSMVGLFFFTRGIDLHFERDTSFARPFFTYGFKAYMVNISIFLNHRLDIFLIKYFLTAADVGFYQIAANVAERLWVIPSSFTHVLLPTLLTMEKGSAEFTAKVCRNSFLIMIVLAAMLVTVSKFFISLLYGTPYLPSAFALYAVIWGVVAATVKKILGADFASRNRQEYTIIASTIGIAVNLGGNLYMIPRYGIVGAGIATSFSSIVASAFMVVFFSRQQKIPVRRLLVPTRDDFSDYRAQLVKSLRFIGRKIAR